MGKQLCYLIGTILAFILTFGTVIWMYNSLEHDFVICMLLTVIAWEVTAVKSKLK